MSEDSKDEWINNLKVSRQKILKDLLDKYALPDEQKLCEKCSYHMLMYGHTGLCSCTHTDSQTNTSNNYDKNRNVTVDDVMKELSVSSQQEIIDLLIGKYSNLDYNEVLNILRHHDNNYNYSCYDWCGRDLVNGNKTVLYDVEDANTVWTWALNYTPVTILNIINTLRYKFTCPEMVAQILLQAGIMFDSRPLDDNNV